MIRVIVTGAAGRMGCMILKALNDAEGMVCAAAVEARRHPALGRDAGEVAGIGPLGVPVTVGLETVLNRGDVVVDFTSAEASVHHAALSASAGTPMVIGSTGFSADQRQALRDHAVRIPMVVTPNMSAGVNLLFSLVGQVARTLGKSYDIEIIELHHRLKKDAPSGTALRLGEVMADALGRAWEDTAVYARHGVIGPRSHDEIGVQAVRAGDIVGDHTVLFAGMGERVEITHRAHTRETFAHGAVRAAAWVVGRPSGLYDMQDVLGLK